MKTYFVLLMRDRRLIADHEDFNSLQDLQYLAGPIQAKDYIEASELAKRELRMADKCYGLEYDEITVIGHIKDGKYRPWFNRDCP